MKKAANKQTPRISNPVKRNYSTINTNNNYFNTVSVSNKYYLLTTKSPVYTDFISQSDG